MRTLLVLLALLVAAAPAAADPVATLPADVPLSAARGWVAWSVPGDGGWRLQAWHAGETFTPAIAPRPAPFDVDVGTDAKGRAVATFSRCTASGCRARVLDLVSGAERATGLPRPAGASDTTPSMWAGRLAVARRDPRRHGGVPQIVVWSPRTHRTTTLRHGAVPPGRDARVAVETLDLGARLVAFRWRLDGLAVLGHGGWEVRADRLSDGQGVLVGSGFEGEVCTGGVDTAVPGAPAVSGDRVWFLQSRSSCYVRTARLVRFDAVARTGRAGALAGQPLEVAVDGATAFTLLAPEPAGEVAPSCPCTLERAPVPALALTVAKPGSPLGKGV